jgi:hypothetical protein
LAKSKIYYYDNEAIKEPQSELMLKIHSQRGGIQARSVGKYSDGSGRQDGGYRGCSNNINVDKCRNKRDVWTVDQNYGRLRDDLTLEQRSYALGELTRRGLL